MSPIHGGPAEKIETLTYAPGLKGGTDLEAATKTISATSEPASADYSSTHTITAPTDARISVLRVQLRLSVTIDSFGGGGAVLNYRVKRGATSVSTGTLSTAGSTGQKLITFDITTAGLMTGAQVNNLYLWVDTGTCVISEVTFWTAVGSCDSISMGSVLSVLTGPALVRLAGVVSRTGTGTYQLLIGNKTGGLSSEDQIYQLSGLTSRALGSGADYATLFMVPNLLVLYLNAPTVATDLCYVSTFGITIRSTG
jgi:hypothetical protein